MRVGIASSMWRGLADIPFPEYVTYCKNAGAQVIEISGWPDSYGKTLVLDDHGVTTARDLAASASLSITALGCPDDLVQTDSAEHANQVALIRRYVDIAQGLGAGVVSLKVGTNKEGVSEAEAIRLIVEGLKQCAEYAHERHVFLALENRATLTNNVDTLTKILWDVRDLYVRALIDTGNFLQYGYTPDEVVKAVEEIAPYTAHTHLKDGRGNRKEFKPAALGEGELDIPRILRALQTSGYLHPLMVQYEGPDQPGVYPRDVEYVRSRVGTWETGADPSTRLVRGFHHVSISMTSFARAYEFYGEILQLPMRPAQGISYSPVLFFVLPTGEEFHVHLHGPSTHMHVAIEVSDFAATMQRLQNAGIAINGPDRRGDGSDFLFCDDPDGNRLEITHHKTWNHTVLVKQG